MAGGVHGESNLPNITIYLPAYCLPISATYGEVLSRSASPLHGGLVLQT